MRFLKLFTMRQTSKQVFPKNTPWAVHQHCGTATRSRDKQQTVYKQLFSQTILSQLSLGILFTMTLTNSERRRILRRVRELDRARRHNEAMELYQLLVTGSFDSNFSKAA